MTWTSQHFCRARSLRSGVLFTIIASCFWPSVATAQDSETTDSSESSSKSTDESTTDSPSSSTSAALNEEPTSAEALDKSLSEPQQDHKSSGSGQKIAGYVVGGVGVAGVVLGTVFGLRVNSKNNTSNSICPTGQPCSAHDQDRYDSSVSDARSARTISVTSFVVGGAALTTGLVLILTAPKKAKPAAVSFVPAIDIGRVGAALQGVW